MNIVEVWKAASRVGCNAVRMEHWTEDNYIDLDAEGVMKVHAGAFCTEYEPTIDEILSDTWVVANVMDTTPILDIRPELKTARSGMFYYEFKLESVCAQTVKEAKQNWNDYMDYLVEEWNKKHTLIQEPVAVDCDGPHDTTYDRLSDELLGERN